MTKELEARLRSVLQTAYGLDPISLSDHKSGWSAQMCLARVASGSYLLKRYDKALSSTALWTATIDAYVPVLLRLSQGALRGRVSRPVLTRDGDPKYEDDAFVYLLYEYIPGDTLDAGTPTAAQYRELAEILAALHDSGDSQDLLPALPREDFALPFCHALEAYFESEPEAPEDMAALLEANRGPLLRRAHAARDAAARLRADPPPFVPCHTDAHGWNTLIGQRVVLLDWEGLKLAPAEADLFMFEGAEVAEAFFGRYHEARRAYTRSEDAMLFYLNRRTIEDVWADVERLTLDGDAIPPAVRAKTMTALVNLCRIAREGDAGAPATEEGDR